MQVDESSDIIVAIGSAIAKIKDVSPVDLQLGPDTPLFGGETTEENDLELDSLDVLELIIVLEDDYGLYLRSIDDLDLFDTVSDLAQHLEKH